MPNKNPNGGAKTAISENKAICKRNFLKKLALGEDCRDIPQVQKTYAPLVSAEAAQR